MNTLDREILYNSAKNGDIDSIKLMMPTIKNNDELTWKLSEYWDIISEKASKGGNLSVLQWLDGHGYPIHSSNCKNAANYGHLEIVKWIIKCDGYWDHWTCYNAKNGMDMKIYNNILDWLIETGNCKCGRKWH